MSKIKEKARLYGIIGTLIAHIILLLVLLFYVMDKPELGEEEGLAVALGAEDLGGSDLFEPTPASEIDGEPAPETPDPAPATNDAYQTQNIEDAVALPKAEEDKKKREQDALKKEQEKIRQQQEAERKRKEEEQRRIQEEQRKKAEAIAKRASNVFGQNGAGGLGNDASSTGKGDGSGLGSQGKVTGADGNPMSNGSAKSGNGNSWSLAGRSIVGGMVSPKYNVQEEGTVVVNIIVDKDGNVVTAEVGRGTNIDNKQLLNAAVDAAKKTKFSPLKSGTNNQSGKMTYRFDLK